jgi:hypothetical protein
MPIFLSDASVTPHHAFDPLPGYQCDRLPHADMQGRMHNARLVKADHQVDIVYRRAGFTRDERRIAVEGNVRCGYRAFGLRRSDDSFDVAGERGLDGAFCARKRCSAIRGINRAELYRRVAAVARVEQVDRPLGPVGIGWIFDDVQGRRQACGTRMKFDRRRVAHQQWPAQGTHVRIDRGFERDLGSNACGVPRCNGDTRQRHGSASVSGAPAYNGGRVSMDNSK